jgi:flagellar protein FlaI
MIEVLDEVWGGDGYAIERDGIFTPRQPLAGFKELERYEIEPPFSSVVALRNSDGEAVYHLEEPPLSEMEQALMRTVNERLRDILIMADEEPEDRARYVVEKVYGLLPQYRRSINRTTAYRLGYYFLRNLIGFGRIEPVMRDPAIEDISCNGPGLPVYVVHSRHGNMPTSLVFEELELTSFTIKLAQRGGKLLSVAQPLMDAALPDGSRIQASLGREVTSRGSAFTIRKFRESPLTCIDLIEGGTHTLDSIAFLWLSVELRCSMLVMGATASGKTTTLNALSQFIPPTKKIVSIEDTRELKLWHENWLAAVTREGFTTAREDRIGMYDLLRSALRQRPDYLIVGEIRGEEGLTLFQAMATGHTCYSTMHAGSVENAVHRMENKPIGVPRVMLASLDFFILQGQVDVGGRAARKMLSLTEINGVDPTSRNMRTNEVFRWDADTDELRTVAQSASIERGRAARGWSQRRLDEEFQARRAVIQGLVEAGDREFDSVARAVTRFYNDHRDGLEEAAQ